MVELVRQKLVLYSIVVLVEILILFCLGVVIYKVRNVEFAYQDKISELQLNIQKALENRKILVSDLSFVTGIGYLQSLVMQDPELSQQFVRISPDNLYTLSQFSQNYGRRIVLNSYALNVSDINSE